MFSRLFHLAGRGSSYAVCQLGRTPVLDLPLPAEEWHVQQDASHSIQVVRGSVWTCLSESLRVTD